MIAVASNPLQPWSSNLKRATRVPPIHYLFDADQRPLGLPSEARRLRSSLSPLLIAEIGVRLALGADPWRVAGDIVRQGGLVALSGVGIGLAISLAGTRLLESLLYGVSSRDPIIFAATAVVLQAVALVACWFPARRAARLNPLEALR